MAYEAHGKQWYTEEEINEKLKRGERYPTMLGIDPKDFDAEQYLEDLKNWYADVE